MNDLGKCCQDKSSVATPFYGPTVTYTGEMKVKTRTDTVEPAISTYNELPNGRKLLVDWMNKKVKMFDDQNLFMSEVVLGDGIPWSLVLLSTTEAVVSSMNDALHYLHISDVLKWTKTKRLSDQLFVEAHKYIKKRSFQKIVGMDRYWGGYGEGIIAMLETGSHQFSLATFDRNISLENVVYNYKKVV